MRKTHCRKRNVVRNIEKGENEKCKLQDLVYGDKLKDLENEKHTLQDMKYGEEHGKSWKMRNTHCRTWNMARKLKKRGK